MRHVTARGAVAVLTALLAAGPSQAQSAEDAIGVWEHPENKTHVELYRCGEALCGRIVAIADAQKTDEKNPKAELRSRPIVGLVILDGAKRTGPAQWRGNLYNRLDGGTYAGTITAKSRSALDLQGCTAFVLCRTVTWTRIR